MPIQPIRNSANYDKYFSNEIRNLLNETIQSIVTETIPSIYITPEIFFLGALDNQDCLLYKVLNSHLTTIKIESIYQKIYDMAVNESTITVSRPNRTIDFSGEMKILLQKTNQERIKNNDTLITSDHVLMALMSENLKPFESLYNLFAEEMLSYDIVKSLSSKIHEATNSIANIENLTPRFITTTDIGSSNGDIAGITICGNFNNGEGMPPQLMEQMEKAFETLGIAPTKKKVAKKSKNSINFCTNLNEKAEKGQVDPLIGRHEEISKIIKIFGRRKCNNVALVGESGVGKTAIIEGLAKQIVDGNPPYSIKDCTIFALNFSEIIAGTQFKGMFEDRLNNVIKELIAHKNAILFIDDVQNILSDRQKSDYDFMGITLPLLTDSKVKIIVSTTPKGFHSCFDNDPVLKTKFQKIIVDKLSLDESIEILKQNKGIYEKYHNVVYNDEAIESCAKLSEKYITDKCLPSSAIDILDEAGSSKKIDNLEPESAKIKREAIAELKKEKEELIKQDKIGDAKNIDYTISGLMIDINEINDALGDLRKKEKIAITDEDIYRAVSEHTNIPMQKLTVSEKKALAKIEDTLKQSIIGQDEAISVVSRAIKRNKIGLGPENRPIFSCMCIGATGVGKTLLAKKLAKEIFGDEKYLVRFDMSEYNDKTAVNKLIGASAGYVGYSEGGLLTEAIKNKKHCVLLIDEIEKATEEIFNIFLQVLDEGCLTDNTGQKVDFKNTILILTSNVGAKRAANAKGIGFVVNDNLNRKEIIESELKQQFPPEFINRLDEIVYFNNLTDDNLKSIIRLEINRLNEKTTKIGMPLLYNEKVVEHIFKIIEKDKEYGARPILRAIQTEIENKITDLIIENDYEQHCFNIEVINNELVII